MKAEGGWVPVVSHGFRATLPKIGLGTVSAELVDMVTLIRLVLSLILAISGSSMAMPIGNGDEFWTGVVNESFLPYYHSRSSEALMKLRIRGHNAHQLHFQSHFGYLTFTLAHIERVAQLAYLACTKTQTCPKNLNPEWLYQALRLTHDREKWDLKNWHEGPTHPFYYLASNAGLPISDRRKIDLLNERGAELREGLFVQSQIKDQGLKEFYRAIEHIADLIDTGLSERSQEFARLTDEKKETALKDIIGSLRRRYTGSPSMLQLVDYMLRNYATVATNASSVNMDALIRNGVVLDFVGHYSSTEQYDCGFLLGGSLSGKSSEFWSRHFPDMPPPFKPPSSGN